MEKDSLKPMTPFDELTVPPELQIMKLLLPYTPASNQQMLGILIKFLELQHTVHLFRHAALKTQSQTSNGNPPSFADILDEISPYLPSQGLQMIHTFHEIMNIMELAKLSGKLPIPMRIPLIILQNLLRLELSIQRI